LQQSERFAQRLEQVATTSQSKIELAWQLAFGRDPLESERRVATVFIERHGTAAFCRYLLNANEFVSID
jgi:hypothetical protein